MRRDAVTAESVDKQQVIWNTRDPLSFQGEPAIADGDQNVGRRILKVDKLCPGDTFHIYVAFQRKVDNTSYREE
jgi:hypothetical protein